MYVKTVKRIIDIVLSLCILIVLWPVLLIVGLAVKLDSEGPVIFAQERIGLYGKVFKIYKFRTMCVGAEKKEGGVYCEKGDPRVTRIGKILRATSLDELPQIVNILMGDMSFIGPRPPLTYHPWEFDKYSDEQRRMFDVRPGITGWAQINGRKCVQWDKRIEMNVWYVDNVSFILDIKIFFETIIKVFKNSDNENVGKTVAEPQPIQESETILK